MEDSHEHELMKNIISRLISQCSSILLSNTDSWLVLSASNSCQMSQQHCPAPPTLESHQHLLECYKTQDKIIIIQEHESRFLEAWILTSWRERRGYLHWTLQCKKVAAVEVLKNHVGWLLLAASVSGRNAAQGCVAGAGGDWLLCWAVSV